jgi:hypothetical protein
MKMSKRNWPRINRRNNHVKALIRPTIMDRSCAATILSEVEQAGNAKAQRLLQNNRATFQLCFSFCPRRNGLQMGVQARRAIELSTLGAQAGQQVSSC